VRTPASWRSRICFSLVTGSPVALVSAAVDRCVEALPRIARAKYSVSSIQAQPSRNKLATSLALFSVHSTFGSAPVVPSGAPPGASSKTSDPRLGGPDHPPARPARQNEIVCRTSSFSWMAITRTVFSSTNESILTPGISSSPMTGPGRPSMYSVNRAFWAGRAVERRKA
jgi:hypothetical protein